MPRKSNNKKQKKSKSNKSNKKNYNKKSLTKKQYNAVKKIAYKINNMPSNKEWQQVRSGIYINNCGTLYQPQHWEDHTDFNGWETHLGNFEFYPLTNLGTLDNKVNSNKIGNDKLLNLKSTKYILKFVNTGTSDSLSGDRAGHFSGKRFSIQSIQIKGKFILDNTKHAARPGMFGFRVVKGPFIGDREALTILNNPIAKNIVPEVSDVYRGMESGYKLDTQAKIDDLRTFYLRDPAYRKAYKTILKKYTIIRDVDMNREYVERYFNIIKRFKYPLELVYPDGCFVPNDTYTDQMWYAIKNNLFFVPYFSYCDTASDIYQGTTIVQDTNEREAYSNAGSYKIEAQIIINYSDS